MLAVLAKRAGIVFPKIDVFVNVAGGVRLTEPGTDLAVALAIAGSAANRAISASWAVLGELGLGGEVRRVARTEMRLAEAAAVGMEAVIVPESFKGTPPAGIRCHRVRNLSEAIALLG
jgi:DNA repair protein RadA/Sms